MQTRNMMKEKNPPLTALLCIWLLAIGGCGGGSSDSVLTGQTTATAENSAGCYNLDWEFKPGSISKTTFRYVSEPTSGPRETGTLVSTFTADGIVPSNLFPGNQAFKTVTTVVEKNYGFVSYMRRTSPWTFELAETIERSGRFDGFGPIVFTTTTFSPTLKVTTPTLAVGQQEVQHRKGNKTVSRAGFGALAEEVVDTTETIKLTSIETITVEAGRYETCRFEHTSSSTPGLSTTRWVMRGQGVTVKTTTTEFGKLIHTEEATSVEVDGKRL
jgi:hypothetical protein